MLSIPRCCRIPAVERLSRDTTNFLVVARDMQCAGPDLRSLAECSACDSSLSALCTCHAWRRHRACTPTNCRAHRARPCRHERSADKRQSDDDFETNTMSTFTGNRGRNASATWINDGEKYGLVGLRVKVEGHIPQGMISPDL